jgi:hypothetical protein
MPLIMVEIYQWKSRERERERGFQGTSVLSLYFSDPLCLFVAFMVLDIASTRSKMEDVQQHPYKVYKCSLAQFVAVELVQDVQDRKQIVIKICMLCSLQAVFNTWSHKLKKYESN